MNDVVRPTDGEKVMNQTKDPEPRYEQCSIDELEFEGVRDIRSNVVDDVKQRLKEHGYNPARPLRVVPVDGKKTVGDGNHRLQALNELDWEEGVPCVIEENADLHTVAVNSNRDEDTYAPSDLFDSLDRIRAIQASDDGLTQEEIGGKIGWGRSKVNNHQNLLDNVDTRILDLAREHQKGRVSSDDTNVSTFNFSEGWFRTIGGDSSLYELDEERQQEFIEWFCENKNCNPGKNKVNGKVDELAEVQFQLNILSDELNASVEDDEMESIRKEIIDNAYTESSLRDAIQSANEGAKDRTYFGEDVVEQLDEFDDNEFACVVTDPPYGVNYENFRDSDRAVFGEDAPDALQLLNAVLGKLERVCKPDAHLYVFFPTKLYAEVREVAQSHFEVEEVPLVWVKNNISPTQDATDGYKKMYAQKYEMLFHLRAENADNRELSGGSSPNVLEHDIPKAGDRWHDSQKPIGLWGELLENSTGVGETILDPFAGSGSSLLAAKEIGRHYVGVELDNTYEGRFKREVRELEE